ncbi:MAG TPA: pyrrolo-quinoline quinone, partial [Dehalococcoidia bacterium]|nr:pyrrolo-quinoline quinone [Dehalococcoidia bacterium]
MTIQHRWQCLGLPAHCEQTVYPASSSDFVYALDSATGEVRWKTELQNSSISSPAIAEGKVFVGSWDDHIYALDKKSGT